MSGKHLHISTDENQDMHKQFGCLNGLFQIFRHQNFMASLRISSHRLKILPPGERGDFEKKTPSSNMHEAKGKFVKDGVKKSERISVESSSSSFSGSSSFPSSTLSSNDCNRTAKLAPSIILCKPQSHLVPQKQPDHIQNVGRTPEFSVKIKAKSEGKNSTMQHVDSLRPQQGSKPLITRVSAHDRSSRVNGRDRNPRKPLKDAPRFSYDERESRDKWKSTAKLEELPRFSLDSRDSLIRKAVYEPMSNSLLEGLHQRNDQQLSGIVKKLMGLEAWENNDQISTSSLRKIGENNHNQITASPILAQKNVSLPKLRYINISAKPNTIFQLESQRNPQNLYPSVYAQIENKLTGLEFKRSGKDLRALKQILEAMQIAKTSIEDQKDVNFYKQSHITNDSPSKLTTPTIKGNNSLKKNKISIAITKPAKGVQKPKKLASSALPIVRVDTKKELISRKNQLRESSQYSFSPMDKRNSVIKYKLERTREIPRIQHNKHWVENKSNPITHISEASTTRRQHHTETFSFSSMTKPKSQVNKIPGETSPSSHQGDTFSAQSQNNVSMTSQNDEVTSICRSEAAARLDEFRPKFESKPVALKQASTVSVLDTTNNAEESPSTVKELSSTFIDENLSSEKATSDPGGPVNIVNSTTPDLVSKFDRENRKYIKHSNKKADAYSIASLCENKDPMHRYVAEILSASGLYKDLKPSLAFTQLHPSGRLINPDLFHILEQSRSRTGAEDDEKSMGKINRIKLHEKIYRKLIFDTTDEILVHILISACYSDLCISTNKLGFRSLTGKKLLKKIYSDMVHLQTNLKCTLPYEDNPICLEIPELVLDIERLIFKDLICEIVADLPSRLNKHYRKLFNHYY